MTTAILYVLKAGTHDFENRLAMEYMEWANSCSTFLGKNTRDLFYGVKTIPGYRAHFAKKGDFTNVQGDGTLMRAVAFITLPEDLAQELSRRDVGLTNPNFVNMECNRLYLHIFFSLIRNQKVVWEEFTSSDPNIQKAIDDAKNLTTRNIAGPVRDGLYIVWIVPF